MLVKWIPLGKIEPLINYEAFATIAFIMLMAFVFYKLFLKRLSERRHGQLIQRFLQTTLFVTFSALTSGLYWIILWQEIHHPLVLNISSYVALLALLLGAVAIIKVAQIYVYLYLFFSNISTGVPRLIGNLFTFVFSVFIFCLLASAVFDLNIATIATTSAVFSLVLGLALQDTLGNFFSGLALQIDRPFQINDWVEIQNGDQKWTGQIQEINWRATFVLSFSNELIMFPNKTIAQSQIIILGQKQNPIRLNQAFRLPLETKIEDAKKAILEGLEGFHEVMKDPAPNVLVTETTESWMTIKVFYSLHDYGLRYRLGDQILSHILINLKEHGLKLAHTTFSIENQK